MHVRVHACVEYCQISSAVRKYRRDTIQNTLDKHDCNYLNKQHTNKSTITTRVPSSSNNCVISDNIRSNYYWYLSKTGNLKPSFSMRQQGQFIKVKTQAGDSNHRHIKK